MKVFDKYDYDDDLNERYVGTDYYEGTGQFNTYGYSYLHVRSTLRSMGETMGLDKIIEEDSS